MQRSVSSALRVRDSSVAVGSAKVEPNPVYSNLGTAVDQQETKNSKTKNTKYVHVFGNMTKFSRTKITNIMHACKEELGEGMPHSYGLVETHILPKDWPRNRKIIGRFGYRSKGAIWSARVPPQQN